MQDHIAKAFDADLHDLKHKVAEMGGIAERQVVEATDSLVRHDIDLARRVIAMDRTTDLLQREIEEKAILTITKRQPVAADLRQIVAALRVAGDLERIGDLAKNIAKREIVIGAGLRRIEVLRGFGHMAELALSQIKDVLDAYAQRDPAAARAVWERDQEIDAIHNSLFRELLTYMMEDPREITFCTHLMFCAKNIERIGDHATNIAETIHYMVEGRMLAEERPKAEMTASTGSLAPRTNGS